MHNRKFILLSILLPLSFTIRGQALLNSHMLEGLPDAKTEQIRTFSRESLYGYIDGGAELYLEFGFDTLVATELAYEGRELKVEIYRMKDPEAAFGIFSVSRFRCNGGEKLTEHICRSAYQLQFCKGPYYVSIINDTGSDADQHVSAEIARNIIGHISDAGFDPGAFFPFAVDEETMKSAVLVRGPLGLYNGVPSLYQDLGVAADYSAMMILKDGKTLASLRFNSDSAAIAFIHGKNKPMHPESEAIGSDSTISVITQRQIIMTF
jgi:hypothetical protein